MKRVIHDEGRIILRNNFARSPKLITGDMFMKTTRKHNHNPRQYGTLHHRISVSKCRMALLREGYQQFIGRNSIRFVSVLFSID